MSEGRRPKRRSELRHALRKLTNGHGVQREDLREALQGDLRELQQCWHINLDNSIDITQRTIVLNLRAHIERLTPRPARQELSVDDRRKQYEHAIRVCFNAVKHPELEDMDLTQRRAWLDDEARGLLRIDESTCGRDLRNALDQIEQQILASGYRPVQVNQATSEVQSGADEVAEPDGGQSGGCPSEEVDALPNEAASDEADLVAPPEPTAVLTETEPAPAPTASPRQRGLKRHHVVVAALLAIALGGLGSLGLFLAHEASSAPTKSALHQLQAPQKLSKVGTYSNSSGTFAALRMPSGIVLNLGIGNVTAGATKYGLASDATYNQVVKTALQYENESSTNTNVGVTVQLVQPFYHKGNLWTVTWRVTAGGSTSELSTSVNVGRPDAELEYISGSTLTYHETNSGKYVTNPIADTDIIDPTQPLQTLGSGAANTAGITASFRVYVPGFSIAVNAKSPADGNWLSTLYAQPGNVLPVAIIIDNTGNITAYGVTLSIAIPRGITYVPGSTSSGFSTTSAGKPIPDGIIAPSYHDPGISLGTLLPGQTVVVRLRVRVSKNVPDGLNLKAVSYVTATNMARYWSSVMVNVQ